jgi:hypothetical protein
MKRIKFINEYFFNHHSALRGTSPQGKELVWNKYFLLFIILYLYTLGIKFLQFPSWDWVQFYLADSLAIPIICSISLKGVQWIKNDATLYLSKTKIVVTVIYLCIFFEFVLPHISPKYTSDYIDCIAYSIGGIIYWFYQKSVMKLRLK